MLPAAGWCACCWLVFAAANNQTKFYISAFCGLASLLVTLLFILDLTGLDLRDGDRFWLNQVEGR